MKVKPILRKDRRKVLKPFNNGGAVLIIGTETNEYRKINRSSYQLWLNCELYGGLNSNNFFKQAWLNYSKKDTIDHLWIPFGCIEPSIRHQLNYSNNLDLGIVRSFACGEVVEYSRKDGSTDLGLIPTTEEIHLRMMLLGLGLSLGYSLYCLKKIIVKYHYHPALWNYRFDVLNQIEQFVVAYISHSDSLEHYREVAQLTFNKSLENISKGDHHLAMWLEKSARGFGYNLSCPLSKKKQMSRGRNKYLSPIVNPYKAML